MQISPPIPFVDATQNNVKHPNDMKPGTEFVRLTMYTGEGDPAPSWPWPTYTWGTSLHGTSPAVDGVQFTKGDNCNDWFELGAYLVGVAPTFPAGVGQIEGSDVIVWCSPGPIAAIPSVGWPDPYDPNQNYFPMITGASPIGRWDVSWTIDTYVYPNGWSQYVGGVLQVDWHPLTPKLTLTNTYYTGSGSEGLAGVTTLRYAVTSGAVVALFDDNGIGHLSYTGDWNLPFDYQRRSDNFITCSWPVNVNGWVYFIDRGGRVFRTDGSYVLEVGGGFMAGIQKSTASFNAKMLPELAAYPNWPDTLASYENPMQFDGGRHRLVFKVNYSGIEIGLALIEINSGAFQFLPSVGSYAGVPVIETGGIKLAEPANRTQVFYADIDFEIEGSPDSYSAVPDDPITLGSTGNDIQSLGIYSGFEIVVLQRYIDLGSNTITFPAPHGFTNGQQVVYNAHGGSPISGLVDHSTYYVIYVSDSAVQLSQTATVTSGTSLVLAATNAFDGTMSDGPDTYILTSGRQTVRCALNLTVDRVPRFRITLNGPPNGVKCRVWGFQRIAFDVNGELP